MELHETIIEGNLKLASKGTKEEHEFALRNIDLIKKEQREMCEDILSNPSNYTEEEIEKVKRMLEAVKKTD